MKSQISLLILIIALFSSALAIRVKEQISRKGNVWAGHYSVDDLDTSKTYYIFSEQYNLFFGKDFKGWVFNRDSGSFSLSKLSSSTFRLKHSSGKYLSINNSGRSFVSSAQSSTALTLTNKGGGICISGSGNYLRMYYQYVFPIGEYRTNTATSCNSWEIFSFQYRRW